MKKQRHYFANKRPSSQGNDFAVVAYGCESWTIKKAEHWRMMVFELWCWRRLESPLECKEIKPVHPKGHQLWIFSGRTGAGAEAETPIIWPRNARADTLEKTLILSLLKAGGEGNDRGWDGWVASPTWWTWVWESSGCWWWTGKSGVLQSKGLQRVGHDWATELN